MKLIGDRDMDEKLVSLVSDILDELKNWRFNKININNIGSIWHISSSKLIPLSISFSKTTKGLSNENIIDMTIKSDMEWYIRGRTAQYSELLFGISAYLRRGKIIATDKNEIIYYYEQIYNYTDDSSIILRDILLYYIEAVCIWDIVCRHKIDSCIQESVRKYRENLVHEINLTLSDTRIINVLFKGVKEDDERFHELMMYESVKYF